MERGPTCQASLAEEDGPRIGPEGCCASKCGEDRPTWRLYPWPNPKYKPQCKAWDAVLKFGGLDSQIVSAVGVGILRRGARADVPGLAR